MTLPRLSVITPSFNQGRYLERAIRSVLDQNYDNLEYIVVDGGSTDESVQLIKRYSDRLAWWVSEPDKGQTHALNKGLRKVTGELVTYLNSDDYYLPGAFRRAVMTIVASERSWLAGACRFIDEDGRLVETWTPTPPPRWRYRSILMPWGVPQPSTFWRCEMFERFGGFREDMHYVFDTEFGLRLMLGGEMPLLIDDELSVRYLHDMAKSADPGKFNSERARLVQLMSPRLAWWERGLLRARLSMGAAGLDRAREVAGKLKRAIATRGCV